MKILHSGTLNPHTHTQTFIDKAQRLTNLSTLAHIIDMLFFISMTLFRFLKFEIAFLHFLFNLVFNWQKRHDSKASTYLNTIPLYPIVWRQRGPGMSTDDKSIHPSQTRVPDMKRGVRLPGMSTARGNLRFVVHMGPEGVRNKKKHPSFLLMPNCHKLREDSKNVSLKIGS